MEIGKERAREGGGETPEGISELDSNNMTTEHIRFIGDDHDDDISQAMPVPVANEIDLLFVNASSHR